MAAETNPNSSEFPDTPATVVASRAYYWSITSIGMPEHISEVGFARSFTFKKHFNMTVHSGDVVVMTRHSKTFLFVVFNFEYLLYK